MKQILTNWNLFRFLRLIIGLAILVQAIMAKDIFMGMLGLVFTSLPLLNIGCCGSAGCAAPVNKITKPSKEITYEEVA